MTPQTSESVAKTSIPDSLAISERYVAPSKANERASSTPSSVGKGTRTPKSVVRSGKWRGT
eukprot:10047726-Alexandrium_andersonii.AAC.2